MRLHRTVFDIVTTEAVAAGLIDEAAARQALALVDGLTPFTAAVELANSVHVHTRVDDVDSLASTLANWGQAAVRRASGYLKYGYAGGITLVFSTHPIAEDERSPDGGGRRMPYVDHLGVDLRRRRPDVDEAWRGIPAAAEAAGWRVVVEDRPVRGIRSEVDARTWAYPPAGDPHSTRPVELALGPLRVFDVDVECDLRPPDPAYQRA